MARKAKIGVKIGANGKRIVATFPVDRLRGLLASIPEGEDRTVLEEALAQADEIRATQAQENRLNTPLSIESLIPLGWMLAGEYSTLAYGAVRMGDFRDEGDGHWAYGPAGAFDREDDGVRVMRGAIQAGVMSEKHAVYRLGEPTTNTKAALEQALAMEADWREQLSPKRNELADLPEGAIVSPGRNLYGTHTYQWRIGDNIYTSEIGVNVRQFECDAVLNACFIGHELSLRGGTGIARTREYRWDIGRRAHDPKYDGTRKPRPLSGPYDCVLGKVWAATHNAPLPNSEYAKLPSLITRNSSTYDRRDNIVFPLPTEADANIASSNFAIQLGIIEGSQSEMPSTLPVLNAYEVNSTVFLQQDSLC